MTYRAIPPHHADPYPAHGALVGIPTDEGRRATWFAAFQRTTGTDATRFADIPAGALHPYAATIGYLRTVLEHWAAQVVDPNTLIRTALNTTADPNEDTDLRDARRHIFELRIHVARFVAVADHLNPGWIRTHTDLGDHRYTVAVVAVPRRPDDTITWTTTDLRRETTPHR